MSAEFAMAENCQEPPGTPERNARVREIIHLDNELSAGDTLENIAHAVKYTENIDPSAEPEYYQIVYDKKNRVVNVYPYFSAAAGARAYDEEEIKAEKSQSGVTSVLVEADNIENLKAAYPNYFGDVQMFRSQLRAITQGEHAVEYEMPKRIAPPRTPPRERPDDSWLRGSKRWR
jgi:predicted oxidoreductase (fatty acid repression mutant protein)